MRGIWKVLLAGTIVGLIGPAGASDEDPTDLPRIEVVGTLIDGFVVCLGSACALALSEVSGRYEELSMERTLEPETEPTREQFCSALMSKRPKGCDADNPPSTPGLDPAWQPNGCGTGGASNFILDTVVHLGFGDYYSGDLDRPYRVSFKAACDAHDGCWGIAGDRATCDNNFDSSMRSACGTLTGERAASICRGFAGAYMAAVTASDIGNDNYANAVSQRHCALWAHDMKANRCDE